MRFERESESERRSLKTRKENFDARNVKEVEEFNFPFCLRLSATFSPSSSASSAEQWAVLSLPSCAFASQRTTKADEIKLCGEKRAEGFCRFIFSSPEKEDKKNKLAVSRRKKETKPRGICWRSKLSPYWLLFTSLNGIVKRMWSKRWWRGFRCCVTASTLFSGLRLWWWCREFLRQRVAAGQFRGLLDTGKDATFGNKT